MDYTSYSDQGLNTAVGYHRGVYRDYAGDLNEAWILARDVPYIDGLWGSLMYMEPARAARHICIVWLISQDQKRSKAG